MFVTRCIEKGIDVKVIAQWQGHQNGGKLILGTYSHVRNVHSEEMAKKLVFFSNVSDAYFLALGRLGAQLTVRSQFSRQAST